MLLYLKSGMPHRWYPTLRSYVLVAAVITLACNMVLNTSRYVRSIYEIELG